jgi:hypothetical protein
MHTNVYCFSMWRKVEIIKETPKRYFIRFIGKNGKLYERWVDRKRCQTDKERAEEARRYNEYRRNVLGIQPEQGRD